MNPTSPSCPAIHISGDTLALDPKIRNHITAEAQRLQQRYPSTSVALRIGISEEFDPALGHRVRCELAADLPGRRQLMVREAQKEALVAISGVFAGARKQLRRLVSRTLGVNRVPASASGGEMRAVGT
jgi:ribosome-associated translation inhibitor RaiA